jgi:hypothetical protein
MVLQLFRKEIYLPFLLSISLFLIIDISSYNHIALGQNGDDGNRDSNDNNVREEEKQDDDDDNRDSNDNNVREEEKEEKQDDDDNRDSNDNNVSEEEKDEEEDFEDVSLDELFDDNDDGNRDNKDNNVREEEKEEEDEKEEENEVPFILPFNAVPFP